MSDSWTSATAVSLVKMSSLEKWVYKGERVHIIFAEMQKRVDYISVIFKGLVHPKMKIMSVFAHPHVVPTP